MGCVTMLNYVVNIPFYLCLSFNWIVGVHYIPQIKKGYIYIMQMFFIFCGLPFHFFKFFQLFLKATKYFNVH